MQSSTPITFVPPLFQTAATYMKCKTNVESVMIALYLSQIWYIWSTHENERHFKNFVRSEL